MLKAVLLDIDGTLVDSNDLHAECWVDVLARDGIHVAFDKVRPLIGKGGDKLLFEVAGLRDDEPGGKEIIEARSKLFMQAYVERVRGIRGARELCEKIREAKLQIIVATSAKDEEVDALLDAAGVRDLIERRTTSDDAEASKPDPDIVAAALESGKIRGFEAMMIGDTPYDVEAAARAGVPCIAFRCGGWWKDVDLARAVAIYDGPLDLVRNWRASPIGQRSFAPSA